MKYLIYIITINDNIYIGSTLNLKKRFETHKKMYNKKSTRKLYECICLNGGWHNIKYEIIEELDCESTVEARIREEYWRCFYNANMNTRKAHVTEEELKERIKEKNERNNPINNPKRDQTTIFCNCGGHYLTFNEKNHLKSKMHNNFLKVGNQGSPTTPPFL